MSDSADDTNARRLRPDYDGAGLTNLMSSIEAGRGAAGGRYPPLNLLGDLDLSRYRTILLFVVDGLGYEYLEHNFPDSLIRRHTRGPISSVFPTTTAAAITTILTGLAPAQHGLTGWHIWLESVREVTAVLPFRGRIGREDLASRGYQLDQVLKPDPIYPGLDVNCHVVSPARIAHSAFNRAYSLDASVHAFDGLEHCIEKIDAVVSADQAQKYIYAYWPDLDHLGHQNGIASQAARTHFTEIDAAFGRLLNKLENTDTLVLLTADHGVVDTTTQSHVHLDEHPALTAMLDVPLCGEPRAAYCYVHTGEHGAFEAYIDTELQGKATALRSAVLLDEGAFGPGRLHPEIQSRIGDYTLMMHGDHAIFDRVPGEPRSELIGVHGGLSSAELFIPLAVVET